MPTQILPTIVIFINTLLAFFVLSQNPNASSNRLFALLAFFGALWAFANFMTDVFVSIFWLQTTYALGSILISTGLIWVLLITEDELDKKKIYLISFVALFFSAASYQNGFINNFLSQTSSGNFFAIDAGWGLTAYGLFYLGSTFLIIFKLYNSITKTNDKEKKHQFKSVLIGASITLIVTAFTSFILPHYFSIFLMSNIDSVGFLIFLTFIAYSITRHHLFNIRVITIELITFGLWTIILIRTLLANTLQERLIEGGLLVVTVVFGIMLIRSALKEIGQREHIEQLARDLEYAYAEVKDLNEHLEMKVTEQTKEITRAYEVEKKARGELEKLDETKNELITTAQHNLRTPLTALRWQLEEIRKSVGDASKSETSAENNGNDGDKASDAGNNELQKAVKESEASVMRLTEVLEDFLKIAKVRVGEK